MKRLPALFFILLFSTTMLWADANVKIMTFNIERNIYVNSDGSQSSDFNTANMALSRIINYYHPDIILLQETVFYPSGGNAAQGAVVGNNKLLAWANNHLAYMDNDANTPGVQVSVYTATDDDGFGLRQAIISRYPFVPNTTGTLTTGGRPIRGIPTATVLLPTGYDYLRLYVVHYKCCNSSGDSTSRQADANATKILMTDSSRRDLLTPYMIAGDLNEDEAYPQSTLTSTYHPVTTTMEGLGYTLNYPCNPVPVYLHCRTASSKTISVTSSTRRFDYILYSNYGVTPLGGEVINTTQMSGICPLPTGLLSTDSSNASDHCSVVANFTIKTPIVKGQIIPGSWAGGSSYAGVPVEVTIKNANPPYSITAYTNTTLDAQGYFNLPPVPRGEYLIYARVDQCLTRVNSAVLGDPTPTLPTLSVIPFQTAVPGDYNGDNMIDDFDLNEANGNFGSFVLKGDSADFNFDGVIDDFDLNIVNGSFGAVGD